MLSDFIAKTHAEPFAWGRNDCALWCASAVEHETGIDPAADLRGTYETWTGCRRVIMRAGGLLSLVSARMERLDLRALDGDGVAVLRVEGRTLCGLIHAGRAVLKTAGGMQFSDDFRVLRGWSWPQL